MAGAAATLYMIRIGATRYDAGFILGVKAFTAAVMGGIGNLRGALLGGLVLGVAENWGSAILGSQWKDVVAFVLLDPHPAVPTDRTIGRVARKGTRMSTQDERSPEASPKAVKAPRRSVGDRIAGAPKWVRICRHGAGAALLAYALPILNPPFISTPDTDFGGVLFIVAIYSLVALGLNIVVGYAGLLDLGYVGFYAVGAYTVAVLTSQHGSWPFLATIPVAVAVTMLSGVMLGAPTLRVRGDYLAIVTLGFRRDHSPDRGQHRVAGRRRRHPEGRQATVDRDLHDPAPQLGLRHPADRLRHRRRSSSSSV